MWTTCLTVSIIPIVVNGESGRRLPHQIGRGTTILYIWICWWEYPIKSWRTRSIIFEVAYIFSKFPEDSTICPCNDKRPRCSYLWTVKANRFWGWCPFKSSPHARISLEKPVCSKEECNHFVSKGQEWKEKQPKDYSYSPEWDHKDYPSPASHYRQITSARQRQVLHLCDVIMQQSDPSLLLCWQLHMDFAGILPSHNDGQWTRCR